MQHLRSIVLSITVITNTVSLLKIPPFTFSTTAGFYEYYRVHQIWEKFYGKFFRFIMPKLAQFRSPMRV
jgi:hypothetical protein